MKINYRQASILIFLSLIAMKLLALPSLLYTKSENMSWLVALALMTVDAIYAVIILSLIKKNQNENINEFMKKTIGPVLSKLFMLFLLFQFAIKFANLVDGLNFFVTENFYAELKWPIYSLPLTALIGFMAYKGIRNIARVSEMFCWAIVIGCLYVAFKAIKGVDAQTYLPMFEKGFYPLLNSGLHHIAWFGSSTFLLMLFGNVDFSNEKKWKLASYLIWGIIFVQILYFVFYGLFGVTSPIHNFCLSDMCQFATGKTTTDELVWLVVSLWVVGQAIQIAVYCYCICVCFMSIFNTKNIIVPIILTDAFLIGLIYYSTKTINFEHLFFSWPVQAISITAQYIIPIILCFGNLRSQAKKIKGG